MVQVHTHSARHPALRQAGCCCLEVRLVVSHELGTGHCASLSSRLMCCAPYMEAEPPSSPWSLDCSTTCSDQTTAGGDTSPQFQLSFTEAAGPGSCC